MKGREPNLEELFAPLAGKYTPSTDDRRRLSEKLRPRLATAVSASIVASEPTITEHCRRFLARRWPWLAAGAVVIGAGVFTVAEPRQSSIASLPPPSTAPSIVIAGPAETVAPEAPSGVAPVATPSVDVEALPSAAPVKSAPIGVGDDPLARETRLWREANRALNDGDFTESLRLLDEHARAFPRGVLADERVVERIVVFCRMGRREDAVREARAFVRAHRASPLRARIESTCASSASADEREPSDSHSSETP